MADKQAEAQHVSVPPPPYTQPPAQPGYPPQPACLPQGQPGYPAQGQPGYPPQGQPGYPPQGQYGYPQPGYAPQPYQPPPPQQIVAPSSTVTNNVTVVTGAPQTVIAEIRTFPPDHCGLAWFACLCCFWPLGICAILSSNNTREAISRGDYDSAHHSSMMARKYANWSIGIGVCLIILIIIINITTASSRR